MHTLHLQVMFVLDIFGGSGGGVGGGGGKMNDENGQWRRTLIKRTGQVYPVIGHFALFKEKNKPLASDTSGNDGTRLQERHLRPECC